MTLAQSLHRQLSGNSVWLILFALILLSCDPYKKTTKSGSEEKLEEILGNVKYDHRTGSYEVDTDLDEPMDTVYWQIAGSAEFIPIRSDELTFESKPAAELKSSYRIALVLPFQGSELRSGGLTGVEQERALQFFGGIKIALEELDQEGHNLEIEVIDAGYGQGIVPLSIRNSEFDVILGPLRDRKLLPQIAAIAKEKQVAMVSPIYPTNNTIQDNPYHIQISPSYENHCRTILEHIAITRPNAQLSIIGRATKRSRMADFTRLHEDLQSKGLPLDSLNQIIVDTEDPTFNKFDFSEYVDTIRENVIIVPAFSGADGAYVNSILRLISISNRSNNITVYGMPAWKKFNNINYEYYKNLNVHLTSDFYINEVFPNVKSFQRTFYSMYGAHPNDEAYKGYDLIKYFATALKQFGTGFYQNLDQLEMNLLHTKLSFQNVVSEENQQKEQFDIIERVENGFVHVLSFEEYEFISAK
jgi:hypothetical protein